MTNTQRESRPFGGNYQAAAVGDEATAHPPESQTERLQRFFAPNNNGPSRGTPNRSYHSVPPPPQLLTRGGGHRGGHRARGAPGASQPTGQPRPSVEADGGPAVPTGPRVLAPVAVMSNGSNTGRGRANGTGRGRGRGGGFRGRGRGGDAMSSRGRPPVVSS
jgi:hypothetical protein